MTVELPSVSTKHDFVKVRIYFRFFIQAPARRRQFQSTFPELTLPPEPCKTRCGTWLASEYYCANFDAVKSIIDSFDVDEAVAIPPYTEKIWLKYCYDFTY